MCVQNSEKLDLFHYTKDLLIDVYKLELPLLARQHREPADQRSETGTIDKSHARHVEQDLFLPLSGQIFELVAKQLDFVSKDNSSAQVNYGYAVHLAFSCCQGHTNSP